MTLPLRAVPALGLVGALLLTLAVQMQASGPANDAQDRAVPFGFPEIGRPEAIHASLQALESRGWNLSQAQRVKHSVVCLDTRAANAVRAWAQSNGFEARPVETHLAHGGQEQYSVDLLCECVLSEPEIRTQVGRVFEGASGIDGAIYFTWMAEAAQ